ncbi:FAD-dependent oxidoreductase [Streptomyces sp. NPDC002896]|uniref:FAD-dependent oxidoreductase n=1 Tax=Streptomyces sp. NPDC002896 TaxID=3154438 RepID=UPI00331AAFE1
MTAPDEAYDVVVAGGGGAGLAAAIEAAAAGARVVVLEKAGELRGSTGRSVGSIAASRTPDQHRLGIDDSADRHLADYRKLSGALADIEDPELARVLTDNATATTAWLRSLGVEFYGPVGEPPHTAPRLHNVLPGSRAYIHHLHKRARRLGVTIRLNTEARRLLTERGRVTGVEAGTADGRGQTYAARCGVVLATGDFSASADMKRTWIDDTVASFVPVNPYATGDAQRMAMDLGAQMLNAEVFDVPSMRLAPPPSDGLFGLLQRLPPSRALTLPIRWGLRHLPGWLVRSLMMGFVTTYLSPREALFEHGAILVDAAGALRSGADENINLTVARLGVDGGYIIGDRALYERFSRDPHYVATAPGVAHAYLPDFRRARKDVYAEAPTLDGLARRIGVPADALTAAVRKAGSCAAGRELDQPPYFALGPVRAYLIQTNGGLRISERMEVLSASGDPIPGLYAAGNAGQGGLALYGHGHHLGWAFTSGRIAGRQAAPPPR